MVKPFWIVLFSIMVIIPSSLFSQHARPDFEQAKQALKSGDYPRAEADFRALLVENPSSPEIMDDLGIALELQNKSDEAARTFRKVLKLKRLPDAISLLAVEYCRNHQFHRATPLLKEAENYLDDPNIMAIVGPCFLEADRPEGAILIYEQLVRLGSPPEDENHANLIRAYFDLSHKALETLIRIPGGLKYARAIEAAKRDSSLDAKSLFPEAYLHAPYLKKTMPIEALVPLLESHPNDPALLYILGVQCAEHASDIFDQLESQWPDSIALKQLIAELKDASGDRDGAIQAYEQIIKSYPDAPRSVHFALGLMYAERNRWEDALREYHSVVAESHGSLYLTQRISEAFLNLGQDEEVLTLLRSIVTKADPPIWALRDCGDAAQNLGQNKAALIYLKRASDLDPNDVSIHYRLFSIYRQLNQPQAAAKELASFRRLRAINESVLTMPQE